MGDSVNQIRNDFIMVSDEIIGIEAVKNFSIEKYT